MGDTTRPDGPGGIGLLDTAAASDASRTPEPTNEDMLKRAVRARLFPDRSTAPRVGRFSILDVLGEGGMGTVLTAYDDQLDRRVALKLIKGSATEEARGRMLREAQAMARLTHPNVVTVYDVGEHAGELFVAMEYVRGQTLRDWQDEPGRPLSKIVAKYVQAGEGLAAAHAKGLVHRDFKPHNAMVDSEGRVRVLDFGLASRRDEKISSMTESTVLPSPAHGALDTPLTEAGSVMGTPVYMSPEQFMGGTIDARSDQYSFCVALWEALHGNRPFTGRDPPSLFTAIAQQDFSEPERKDVPPPLADILRRGLQVKAEDRWPDFSSLLDALSAFADTPNHEISLVRRGLWGGAATAVYGALLFALHFAWTGELLSVRVAADANGAVAALNIPVFVALWRIPVAIKAAEKRNKPCSWAGAFARSPLLWVLFGFLAFTIFYIDFAGVAAGLVGPSLRRGLWGMPLVVVVVLALAAAPLVVPSRGSVLWSALLGVAAFCTAMLVGGELFGLGFEQGSCFLGAETAFLIAGLSASSETLRWPAPRRIAALLAAVVFPILVAVALRGPDDLGSLQPVQRLEPTMTDPSGIAVDDCDCPGCVSGVLGPSLSDVDIYRVSAGGPGFSELRVALASTAADAISVGADGVHRLPPPPLLTADTEVSLAVRWAPEIRLFEQHRYCVVFQSVSLPSANGLSVARDDPPRLASLRWSRDGESWRAQIHGVAETDAVLVELPDELLVDTEGARPFRSIADPDGGRRFRARRSLRELAGLQGRIVLVENGQWSTTLRLEDPEDPDPEAADVFESVVVIGPQPPP